MKSLFDENDLKAYVRQHAEIPQALAARVYTSHLIGQDGALVLHGGGNTSVKLKMTSVVGEEQDVIYVKGSGSDLSIIEPEGFVGLDMEPLVKLRVLDCLSDEDMENQLLTHKMIASAPDPSVEALLHAFLPHTYVDHTHADSILVLTNQKRGEDLIREALGSRVAVLPYIMSGFPLAKAVIEAFEKNPQVEAIVILNHGIFTFAEDARVSYKRMIDYVSRAESFIENKIQGKPLWTRRHDLPPLSDRGKSAARFSQMVRGVCAHLGPEGRLRRFYVTIRTKPHLVDYSLATEIKEICRSGVLTPDHAIRTKNQAVYIETLPEDDETLRQTLQDSVDTYKKTYEGYVEEQTKIKGMKGRELDSHPRVFVVAGLGLVTLGLTLKAARVAADIAEHTIEAKLRAMAMGGYLPIVESHVFDMEYWNPQQKKLGRATSPILEGQIAVVTGSGGALGFGIADRLLAAGAVVVISDIDEARLERVRSVLAERYDGGRIESVVCDVTSLPSVEAAYDDISQRVGGIDILVPNAGIAHVARIEDLETEAFDRVVAVNLTGTFNTIKASVPVFRRQGTGGNIVVVSSKNVFDPGPAFGAYSASKAGAHQMSKIAALELAELGVRVNMLNPDAVFGDEKISSKLWDLVGAERMKSRGLDPEGLREYYRQRSLLKVRILAEHVGNAVVFFASDQTPTTGATLPIDGGIPAAFPR